MSLFFNTGLLQKKMSACIMLGYLPSTDLKTQMGSDVLIESVLLPSNGTNQNLKAKLSNNLSELGLVSPKKAIVLQSQESQVRPEFS